jgi:hypothetical protein
MGRSLGIVVAFALVAWSSVAAAETGFLDRTVTVADETHRYQVYVPLWLECQTEMACDSVFAWSRGAGCRWSPPHRNGNRIRNGIVLRFLWSDNNALRPRSHRPLDHELLVGQKHRVVPEGDSVNPGGKGPRRPTTPMELGRLAL